VFVFYDCIFILLLVLYGVLLLGVLVSYCIVCIVLRISVVVVVDVVALFVVRVGIYDMLITCITSLLYVPHNINILCIMM